MTNPSENKTRPERTTQNRIVRLFCPEKGTNLSANSSTPSNTFELKDQPASYSFQTTPLTFLGYRYLGNRQYNTDNRNIDPALLRANLTTRGYTPAHISAALQKLTTAADTTGTDLYPANLRTYQLLRYGAQVQIAIDQPYETVHFIDWQTPDANDFALAEEVTLKGGHERRPDIVLYLNGIAICVIELKRYSVGINEAIRQLITNQEEQFNKPFFSTVQLLIAANDIGGLHYGTTGTPEKFFTKWKLQNPAPRRLSGVEATEGSLLDPAFAELCNKTRLLNILYNFIIFDNGQKKVPRPHQYAGIKAAQARIKQREGGVIWHTQGSGKSILMVLLAKWLLEHDPQGRILIITSRRDFLDRLTAPNPRLLCALIHKFDLDLKSDPPPIHGHFYVFVDECHRTQGGDMNKQMKRWLPNAIFIGFTGTPLLRRDKQTTRDVFGTNIHTYKFYEAVEDKVILDLKYEARNIPQKLTSQQQIDAWFDKKTKGLNSYQRAVLRKRWASMEKLMSAGDRKQRIVRDIIHDFGTRTRLDENLGTALLVAATIYDACHYFRIFHGTPFGDYCGIVTSYEPNHNSISREPADSDERYKYDTYTKYVLTTGQSTTKYEENLKDRFKKEPANCKLLIVVSKLLTGFDAPTCTYIYLDNQMRDHNLFQAICRTNRLDGDDKDYGYIVDYKELFEEVQESIAVYNSEDLETEENGPDSNIILKDHIQEGRKQLDEAHEALSHLCEPVPPPRDIENYVHYFCGNADNPADLTETEPLRITFYKATATFIRAYATLANDIDEAGYSLERVAQLERDTRFYAEIRKAIKEYAGEELDVKPFEGGMRYLINSYIQAEGSEMIGNLSDVSLTAAIIETGVHDAIAQKLNRKGNRSNQFIAETIINNIRKTIIRDQLTDPKFYEEMSKLLDDLIEQKKDTTESYQTFLSAAEDAIRQLERKEPTADVPIMLQGKPAAIVLFNNLTDIPASSFECPEGDEEKGALALALHQAMQNSAPANWKGDDIRENEVLNAIFPIMNKDHTATQAIFDIIKAQPDY